MVISSFISSILILALGIWAYIKLESTMNTFAEKQLLIEPNKYSYKMWKDMPVTMYQSFTFFNLTNWNQVKTIGQKPKFVEVGPYVYRTIWTKSDINFSDNDKSISFAERKQWFFEASLSKGYEDDQIWTINTPLMTALALIQNAPVLTRNMVSVILDGLGEGAFIKRNIRSLLFEGYSDLIVSVGPLFDRRFANFNGKFAYLYNKNDSVDGTWTVSTGTDELANLNKITRFQNNIFNLTSFASGQPSQGLNEVKAECAPAWSLDHATNGQLFSPFSQDLEQAKLMQQIKAKIRSEQKSQSTPSSFMSSVQPKRFFSRSANNNHNELNQRDHNQELVPNPFLNQKFLDSINNLRPSPSGNTNQASQDRPQLADIGKFIFYPDLCRPLHLLPSKQEVTTVNGIKASRYYIDPRVFMNSSQVPSNKCFEMNPKPALANALAATINSVTGANVALPNLVTGASSPFAMFSPPSSHHNENGPSSGLFERSNHPTSFLNNALHTLSASVNSDQQTSASNQQPVSRLGRVRQLFNNIVTQRMSAASPGSLLPSLAAGPAGMLMGGHFPSASARNTPERPLFSHNPLTRQNSILSQDTRRTHSDIMAQGSAPASTQTDSPVAGSDRWITQFRFKWPRGVFSLGQCQLGAPIYASLPHFLDADDYYLEQVDGLKPNRSLHEFYIDIESTLHSIPVGARARLQLNVATPELRFRNIPNAMIPVLWQEVYFNLDKPVATMLYWSFTMSSTLYKSASMILVFVGLILMIISLVGGFKGMTRKRSVIEAARRGPSQVVGLVPSQEGHRTSWLPHLITRGRAGDTSSSDRSSRASSCGGRKSKLQPSDSFEEIRHGDAYNPAFSACCSDIHNSMIGDTNTIRHNAIDCGPNSIVCNGTGGSSPKTPSSRASSHCELVSSLGPQVSCAGCLLASPRHSPNNSSHRLQQDNQQSVTCDNCIVREEL